MAVEKLMGDSFDLFLLKEDARLWAVFTFFTQLVTNCQTAIFPQKWTETLRMKFYRAFPMRLGMFEIPEELSIKNNVY